MRQCVLWVSRESIMMIIKIIAAIRFHALPRSPILPYRLSSFDLFFCFCISRYFANLLTTSPLPENELSDPVSWVDIYIQRKVFRMQKQPIPSSLSYDKSQFLKLMSRMRLSMRRYKTNLCMCHVRDGSVALRKVFIDLCCNSSKGKFYDSPFRLPLLH
jgi:hypothetical protein